MFYLFLFIDIFVQFFSYVFVQSIFQIFISRIFTTEFLQNLFFRCKQFHNLFATLHT